MAFEADCDASMVLEELRVASTVGFLVLAKVGLPVNCGVSRPSEKMPRRLEATGGGCRLGAAIPNSEFRICPAPSTSLSVSNSIGMVGRRVAHKTIFCDPAHVAEWTLDL